MNYIFIPLRVVVILIMISFNSFASNSDVKSDKKWDLDAKVMSSEITGVNYMLAGFTISRRFNRRWFVGIASLVNTTEEQYSVIDGNIYPIFQVSLVAGYGDHLYENIYYQLSVGRGGGIGEFTEVGGDTIGTCVCSHDVFQASVELNYTLSPSNSVALQLSNISIDNGIIEDDSNGASIAFRHSW